MDGPSVIHGMNNQNEMEMSFEVDDQSMLNQLNNTGK